MPCRSERSQRAEHRKDGDYSPQSPHIFTSLGESEGQTSLEWRTRGLPEQTSRESEGEHPSNGGQRDCLNRLIWLLDRQRGRRRRRTFCRGASMQGMSPIADPHVCNLPPTADRTEYAELHCWCGRVWYLAWFRMSDGSMAGPSWILEGA